jgi:hypothetical protein
MGSFFILKFIEKKITIAHLTRQDELKIFFSAHDYLKIFPRGDGFDAFHVNYQRLE